MKHLVLYIVLLLTLLFTNNPLNPCRQLWNLVCLAVDHTANIPNCRFGLCGFAAFIPAYPEQGFYTVVVQSKTATILCTAKLPTQYYSCCTLDIPWHKRTKRTNLPFSNRHLMCLASSSKTKMGKISRETAVGVGDGSRR